MGYKHGGALLRQVEEVEARLQTAHFLERVVARDGVPDVEWIGAQLFGRPGPFEAPEENLAHEVYERLIENRVAQVLPGMEKKVRKGMQVPEAFEVGRAIFGKRYEQPDDPKALERSIEGVLYRLNGLKAPVDRRGEDKRERKAHRLAERARRQLGDPNEIYWNRKEERWEGGTSEGYRAQHGWAEAPKRGKIMRARGRLNMWRAKRLGYNPNANAVTLPAPRDRIIGATLPLPGEDLDAPAKGDVAEVTIPLPGDTLAPEDRRPRGPNGELLVEETV
jgi:hypothetical protein